MPEPLAYLQGRWMPQSQAALSLHDAGFVLGATVTDLVRTFRHQLFRWDDHLARFRQSCRLTSISVAQTDHEITAAAQELVRHNAALLRPEQDLALVLFATPGPIGYYLGEAGGAGSGPVTFGMHTFPLPVERYRRLFTEGARLVVPSVRHVPPTSVDPLIKQRSRLHWWLAEQEVKNVDPAAWALLLNQDGHITETAAANFLLVCKGAVVSPPRHAILGGISLQVVRDLCGPLNIPFDERPITLDDCRRGDEALLTGTAFCLAGVRRLNDFEIPWPGPIFTKLLQAWSNLVGVNIRASVEA